eukprot:scaffold41698_cov19-Tisochrysis_lutea.AAC.1
MKHKQETRVFDLKAYPRKIQARERSVVDLDEWGASKIRSLPIDTQSQVNNCWSHTQVPERTGQDKVGGIAPARTS